MQWLQETEQRTAMEKGFMYYVTGYFKNIGFSVLKHDFLQQKTFEQPSLKETSVSGDFFTTDDLKRYKNSIAHKKNEPKHRFFQFSVLELSRLSY